MHKQAIRPPTRNQYQYRTMYIIHPQGQSTYLQGCLNRKVKNTSLNLGLGYRKLFNADFVPVVVGGNAFVDRGDDPSLNMAIRFFSSHQYQDLECVFARYCG